ncbi:MAG: tRNA (N(6)-L-threonylcarbamoyladenosine(37)-C(2))-methylthiotransferase MtaB [Syntrophomonadaceae bacterium]|nr:tRNA (N(6)-L-threonylcarbamoyladenosine(37)-C(2))-methylthiotransferase MtaB [Syntrophomonadaceae bacterium]
MPSVAFHTLGCKVNQIETEQIKEDFIVKGYDIVSFQDKADIYIINTCTVTHISDRKSRSIIRRAIRNNPDAVVAAIGCLPQVNADELRKIEGLNIIVGNRDKANIVDIIEDYDEKKNIVMAGNITKNDKLSPVLFSNLHERTRAFIKIQDGCVSYCSYCIVPLTRGPVRSKSPEDVLAELVNLLDLGYKEIVLTGIHTGFYGIDIGNINLLGLLELILSHTNEYKYRLRLSSIEPLEVTDGLISLIKEEDKLCRHLHLPLQSGSNKVLQDMNRRYSREYYYELVLKIAETIPDVAIATDIMVGFPTEDEADFEDTFALIDTLPLTHFHVFKYSPRPATKAYNLKSLVDEKGKNYRSSQLLSLAREKSQIFIKDNLGKTKKLLVERKLDDGSFHGLTDNYLEVNFVAETDQVGDFVTVKLINVDKDNDLITGNLLEIKR